jgi:hypothetical protein
MVYFPKGETARYFSGEEELKVCIIYMKLGEYSSIDWKLTFIHRAIPLPPSPHAFMSTGFVLNVGVI